MTRIKIQLLALSIIALFSLSACGGDGGDDTPSVTPEEQRILDLAGSSGSAWSATSVTFEGLPDERFDNFTLTLQGTLEGSKSYESTNGDPVFNPSGTWELSETNISQLTIDGNSDNVFTISNLNVDASPATLTLTVQFTDSGNVANGVEGTDGLYVFNLEAQ